MLKHLVLTPDRNERRNDFEGAFKPESDRYARWYMDRGDEVRTVRVDVSRSPRRRSDSVRDAVGACDVVDRLALFCHGWQSGVQLGLGIVDEDDRAELSVLCGELCARSTPSLAVALYCCSAGDGPAPGRDGTGSFASHLLRVLRYHGRHDATVFAHTDSGHTTRNADVLIFSASAPDGECPAERGTAAYRRLDERLHDKADDLRWRAPYMTVEELRAELGS